jgi:formylmethanofuran dehydrogenase subunit D
VIAERRSATGTSKVRQAGAVNAQKQVALRVSHVSLGTVSPTDHVVVTLNVYSGDRLVVTRQFGS